MPMDETERAALVLKEGWLAKTLDGNKVICGSVEELSACVTQGAVRYLAVRKTSKAVSQREVRAKGYGDRCKDAG